MVHAGALAAERVERRVRLEPDGTVVALSGKIEFGQGIRTAFAQLVADELDVPLERVRVVLGVTDEVPWDMGTFGSRSIQQEGPLLRRAAAAARAILLARAAARFGVPAAALATDAGRVRAADGRSLAYTELLAEGPLSGEVPTDVALRPAAARRYIGLPQPRAEARAIVTGAARFVADVRLPGMRYGHVARPPVRGALPLRVDDARARSLPGVLAVVRDDALVGVVAERPSQARDACAALEIEWSVPARALLEPFAIPMRDDPGVAERVARPDALAATFTVPHISNAPIGPSAAVADVRPGNVAVHVGTQRPFGVRAEVAALLGVPEAAVHVLPEMPSGTYGRNSTSDAVIEAVRLSRGAGAPVQVQWTREEEFFSGPARPAAVLEVRAALDPTGTIVAWQYDETTNVHGAGPVDRDRLVLGSGRNAIPPYGFPVRATLHIEPTPVRTASFRSLAAAENVFAIESFIDELALAARADPLAFRLRHVDDPRLRRVLELVAERCGWGATVADGRGRGIACSVYHGTYVAQIAEVHVAPGGAVRLERVWCAIDPGLVVNPDGVRNQTEGGIQQTASWTFVEELRHRDGRVTSTAWDTYPIATFRDAPLAIDVLVAGDDTQPSTGVGEPGAVLLAAAAANAVAAACGARVRDLPIGAKRVREAMAARGGR